MAGTFPGHLEYDGYLRQVVLEWDFDALADLEPAREAISPEGERSKFRLEQAQKRRSTRLRERIATAATKAVDAFDLRAPKKPTGRYNTSRVVSSDVDADDLRRKLTEYVLNVDHEVGQHKARVFASVLGITADQWLSLASQIAAKISEAELFGLEADKFGLRFKARIEITGISAQAATVETAWIVRGNRIFLVTAFVAAEKHQRESGSGSGRVFGIQAKDFFAEVFRRADAAGRSAYDETVAKPIVVEGNGKRSIAYECGYAIVVVRDARTGFARWLIRSGNAERGVHGGAVVRAPSELGSFEKTEAYALAFGRVLRENDIACVIETIDD